MTPKIFKRVLVFCLTLTVIACTGCAGEEKEPSVELFISETETETESESKTEAATESESKTETATATATATEIQIHAETEAETETESESESEFESKTEAATETATEIQSHTETETETEAETNFSGIAEMFRRVVKSPDGELNLRLGPSTEYPILGVLYNGDLVYEDQGSGKSDEAPFWSFVYSPTLNMEGYVMTGWIMDEFSSTMNWSSWGVVNSPDGELNVRLGPGMEYEIIDVLHSGDLCWVLDSADGWYKIQSGKKIVGWVGSAYLDIKE